MSSALEVWWEEEPTRRRRVVRFCKRCRVWPIKQATSENFHIVSPRGTAHLAHEFSEGNTACGKDATGKDWWWQT